MKAGKIFLTLLIPLALSACGTLRDLKHGTLGSEFDKSMRAYAQLVRWQELEGAAAHVSPSVLEEYRKQIPAAGKVKFTDYRVVKMECEPAEGKGRATVEFEYYRPPSVTVHTVEDRQLWVYEGLAGSGAWRLKTLLPEFK